MGIFKSDRERGYEDGKESSGALEDAVDNLFESEEYGKGHDFGRGEREGKESSGPVSEIQKLGEPPEYRAGFDYGKRQEEDC